MTVNTAAPTLAIHAAGRTHVGRVRRRNEDAMYVGDFLFAVADGLGGHVAGDIASTTAIDTLKTYDRPLAPSELIGALGQAVSDANHALRRRIEVEPEVSGLGTTLVAMLWSGTTAAIANVGDSRAYFLRRSTPESIARVLTDDHVYGRLVADAPHVPDLPGRLTRFLDGRLDGRSPDITNRELQPGDRLLLCSDGLSAVIPHEVLDAALNDVTEPGETADLLIDQALALGGPDNITAVVLDVTTV